MVLDELRNASLYRSISPRLAKALDYLRKTDFAKLPAGKHPVDGDNVYALVQHVQTRPEAGAQWETHQKYIDVQYLLEGEERMGRADAANLTPATEYDPAKDAQMFKGEGVFFIMRAGSFAIFWPNDAHMPVLAVKEPKPVKKIVMKVLVG